MQQSMLLVKQTRLNLAEICKHEMSLDFFPLRVGVWRWGWSGGRRPDIWALSDVMCKDGWFHV